MTIRLPALAALVALALLSWPPPAAAELLSRGTVKSVGERAPIFSLVSDRGELIEYDKDYYGRHHLVLTFFPAAFTPV